MRRAIDVVVLLAAVAAATLWYRAFSSEPPKPDPAPVASPVEVPAAAPAVQTPAPDYELAAAAPPKRDETLERAREEVRAQREADLLAQEQARIEQEEREERSRRDADRRDAWDRHKSLRQERISEARDRDERAASAKASYEALRQRRRDCARLTKNGSIRPYGCEGINERVRNAQTELANTRNRRR